MRVVPHPGTQAPQGTAIRSLQEIGSQPPTLRHCSITSPPIRNGDCPARGTRHTREFDLVHPASQSPHGGSTRVAACRENEGGHGSDLTLLGTPAIAHAGFVSFVDVDPSGSRFASGGADGTVAIWDVRAGDNRVRGAHRFDAVRAHLLEMAGEHCEAHATYERAARRTASIPERRYLLTRARCLRRDGQDES